MEAPPTDVHSGASANPPPYMEADVKAPEMLNFFTHSKAPSAPVGGACRFS